MKNISKKTFLFLALAAALGSAAQVQKMNGDTKLRYASRIIDRYYVDTVDTEKVNEAAIVAMLGELDPHSQYSNAEETRALTEPLQGNFSGIGIQFRMMRDSVYVIQPVAGGPSEKVGIFAGDRIVAADDTLLSGVKKSTADIMKVLRGPKGSKVVLKVKRPGVGEMMDFRVTRDDIPIHSVDASYMAAPGVGYIKLSRFAEKSAEEVAEAAKDLRKKGMKDLIIDLEYNGGGYLNAATELAEMLLDRGDLIVYTKGDKVPYNEYRASSNSRLADGRIVVMVNQYSASASEILSGALQDQDRGVVVGRRTFGKGLVQRPFPFPDGSMMRLTVARYYTPSGRCIQKPYEKGDEETYEMDIITRYNDGELMHADSVHLNKSEKFSTIRKGRTVYGGGGIMPDLFVPLDTTGVSAYSRELTAKNVYNTYCAGYLDKNRKALSKMYRNEDAFVENFHVTDEMLEGLKACAEREGIKFDAEGYETALPTIKAVVKAVIGSDLFTQSTYYRVVNGINNVYQEALRLITDENAYNDYLK